MSFYRGVHAVLLCFDLSSFESSFDALGKWLLDVERYSATTSSGGPATLAVVGLKSDLVPIGCVVSERNDAAGPRVVFRCPRARAFARSIGALYAEVSAKSGANVDRLFETVARRIDAKLMKRKLSGGGQHSKPSSPSSSSAKICSQQQQISSSRGCRFRRRFDDDDNDDDDRERDAVAFSPPRRRHRRLDGSLSDASFRSALEHQTQSSAQLGQRWVPTISSLSFSADDASSLLGTAASANDDGDVGKPRSRRRDVDGHGRGPTPARVISAGRLQTSMSAAALLAPSAAAPSSTSASPRSFVPLASLAPQAQQQRHEQYRRNVPTGYIENDSDNLYLSSHDQDELDAIENMQPIEREEEREEEEREQQEEEREEDVSLNDWNERFQRVLEKLQGSVEDMRYFKTAHAISELVDLQQDFYNLAESLARRIIMEQHLPDDKKMLKPVTSALGRAGGVKYIFDMIMFKFAVDDNGLYGSELAALKHANQELLGLDAYATRCPTLSFPLMAIFDFLGSRLIAMSLLPISKETLRYGTADGGRTVHVDDGVGDGRHFVGALAKAGLELGLEPHLLKGKRLPSAADIEGHEGTDSRHYLCDFSRTFPPAEPSPNVLNSHLWRFLRPEFVRYWSSSSEGRALCPDAFSGFLNSDPRRAELNHDVRVATQHLLGAVVPNFAATSLREAVAEHAHSLLNVPLRSLFHSAGINLRYIGVCFASTPADDRTSRLLLLTEAIARSLKNLLRARLRELSQALRGAIVVSPHRHALVALVNAFMSDDAELWRAIADHLREQFAFARRFSIVAFDDGDNNAIVVGDDDEHAQRFASLQRARLGRSSVRAFVLARLEQLTGVQFRHSALARVDQLPKRSTSPQQQLCSVDVTAMRVRVKYSGLLARAVGHLEYMHGLRANDRATAAELFGSALSQFSAALGSAPNSSVLLMLCAQTTTKLLELRSAASDSFDMQSALALSADALFSRAIDVHQQRLLINGATEEEQFSHTLVQYAQFLERGAATDMGIRARCESVWMAAIEANPDSSNALRGFARFLLSGDTSLSSSSLAQSLLGTAESPAPSLSMSPPSASSSTAAAPVFGLAELRRVVLERKSTAAASSLLSVVDDSWHLLNN
jgi:Clustered mitochondria/Ras family/Translation initiation factor eIF3 subunit 135